jgi:hypothetical protein
MTGLAKHHRFLYCSFIIRLILCDKPMKLKSVFLLLLSLSAIFSFDAALSFGPNYYVLPNEQKEIKPWLDKITTRVKEHPKYSELIRKLDRQKLVFTFGIGTKGELLKVAKLGGAYIDDSVEKLGREILFSISPLPAPPNQLPVRAGIRLEIIQGPKYPAIYCPPLPPVYDPLIQSGKPRGMRFD